MKWALKHVHPFPETTVRIYTVVDFIVQFTAASINIRLSTPSLATTLPWLGWVEFDIRQRRRWDCGGKITPAQGSHARKPTTRQESDECFAMRNELQQRWNVLRRALSLLYALRALVCVLAGTTAVAIG